MKVSSSLDGSLLGFAGIASRNVSLNVLSLHGLITSLHSFCFPLPSKDIPSRPLQKRTELKQACFDKWEKNPEVVPEECMCDEDWEEARSERFGEAQASLGLDRYSVGYDLPLPSILPSSSEPVANAVEARDFGGPVLETMAGWDTDDMEAGTEGRASPGPEGGRVPDRNETSPYPSR